jgi:hypothetical protein
MRDIPDLTIDLEIPEEFSDVADYLIEKYGITKGTVIIESLSKRRYSKRKNIDDAMTVIAQLEVPPYIAPLKVIVEPENEKLQETPYYYRYIGYLVSEYGISKAAKILNIHRMTLWEVLSQKHSFSQAILINLSDDLSL